MNRKTTLILVSVLILFGLYAWWYQSDKSRTAGAATPTPTRPNKVWDFSPEQLAEFRLTETASGQRLVLAQTAGVWNVVEPGAKPADPTQISTLANNLALLEISASITSTTDLAPFGLIAPAYTLEVKLADGKQLKLRVGDKVPTGTGYYVAREGETNPLVVSEYSITSMLNLMTTPPYLPTPTPTVQPLETVWTIIPDQLTEVKMTEMASGKRVALAQEAGVWNVTEPEKRPADIATANSLGYGAATLEVTGKITSTTDLAQFGLASPAYTLELKLTDGQQLKLLVGDTISSGNGYYVLREGDPTILQVSDVFIRSLIGMVTTPPYLATPTP